MIPSTKSAARKLNPEPGSWSKGRIEHKAYRQMPLLPEEEEPRYRRYRKTRPKHVHKWTAWEYQRSTIWYSWWRRKKMETRYYSRSCKKCGYKEQRTDHPFYLHTYS